MYSDSIQLSEKIYAYVIKKSYPGKMPAKKRIWLVCKEKKRGNDDLFYEQHLWLLWSEEPPLPTHKISNNHNFNNFPLDIILHVSPILGRPFIGVFWWFGPEQKCSRTKLRRSPPPPHKLRFLGFNPWNSEHFLGYPSPVVSLFRRKKK